jgi:hypothetical protein
LTKIRNRYGLAVFQQFFEQIVELCIEAGLVWGKELYVDGSRIEANAAFDNRVPTFYWEEHLKKLFQTETFEPVNVSQELVQKYDGTQRVVARSSYHRKADARINPVDPYASPLSKITTASGGGFIFRT